MRPIGEDGTSDAGNQAPVCATHHEAPHSGWVEGHRGPAEGWEYVRPGGEARGRGADLAWQARRAMSGGGG